MNLNSPSGHHTRSMPTIWSKKLDQLEVRTITHLQAGEVE
jgi:hypothetical protein